MSYTNVYPSRINWENEPNISTPINATNLNKTDYALYSIDQTLAGWDTTKANQSDLLLCVKSIDYDTTTGVFVFTWQNGTTKTVDLNIEKIPVTFSMDANGVITMTTADGTTYTADVGALIKTYTFTDSSTIDFTVTTDASGNKTIVADIVDGSITGTKLQPNYLADCQTAETNAGNSATAAAGSKGDAEAWAVGTRGGVPVPSTDPAYNNNSYYWSQHGASNSLAGLTDVDITNAQDGQTILYNASASKWENGDAVGGGSTIEVTTSESSLYNKTVTITDGTTTISNTFDNSGKATFKGVTLTGTLTISATDGTSTSTKYITVPYFGNYSAVLSFFTATITATFPSNHGATCTCDGQTSSSSPHNFTVNSAGTYSVVCTLDGVSKTESVTITTDGETVSKTFEYGTINLTYSDDFKGVSISCVNGGTTITKTAPSGANAMSFYPPTTGTWTISGTVSGTAYSTTATVTSLSTPVSANLSAMPDGKTVTPTDDIQIWLACAGITDKAYTLLSEVLADTDTYTTLLGDSNACDYMARSTTWSTDIVADADAMRLLGMYDYACDALLVNSTWCTAICGSTYFESVLDTKIPVLTANSQCIASSYYTGVNYETYKMFDGNTSTIGVCNQSYTTLPLYVGYDFTENVHVHKVKYVNSHLTSSATFKLQGSDDNSTWNNMSDDINITSASQTLNSVVPNSTSYRYWRINYSSITASGGQYAPNACEVQFYGRHTAQTDIIHSAPVDTIYYLDNGVQTTLCTTDANGVGTVDWSDLPNGDITLYSSVAKDPDDLTDDYSKSVKVTKNKTEAWLMPEGALYWYGYVGGVETCNTANGWSATSGGASGSFGGTTTYNTNDVALSVGSNQIQAIGSKVSLSDVTLKGIIKTTTLNSGAGLTLRNNTTAKVVWNGQSALVSQNVANTIELKSANNVSGYVMASCMNSRAGNVYALWYE